VKELLCAISVGEYRGAYLFSREQLPQVILLLQDNGYRLQSAELFAKAETKKGIEYIPTGDSVRVEGEAPFSQQTAENFVDYLSETFGPGFVIRINASPPLSEL